MSTPRRERLGGMSAITFDFGNTLVPVSRDALGGVVTRTAVMACARGRLPDADAFLVAWGEERDRQFREAIPQFREPDLPERVVRVLARLRGFVPPRDDEAWDDAAAREFVEPGEVEAVVETYSREFRAGLPPNPRIQELLAGLAGRGYALGILSNWPLAATIDEYVEAAGWLPYLRAVVVSQRVGVIKPHPAIFAAARTALGGPAPGRILHVGDDWAADIVGALAAGWRAAYVPGGPGDSPLPSSVRDASAEPDLELRSVTALPERIAERATVDASGRPE